MEEIEPMIPVKLNSLNDLARLASSTTALGHVTYIVHFPSNNKHYYGVFIVFRDYYKLYGLPMFYYIETERELAGNYILFRSDDAGETIEVAKGTKPGWIALPIINVSPDAPLLKQLQRLLA